MGCFEDASGNFNGGGGGGSALSTTVKLLAKLGIAEAVGIAGGGALYSKVPGSAPDPQAGGGTGASGAPFCATTLGHWQLKSSLEQPKSCIVMLNYAPARNMSCLLVSAQEP